MTGQMLTLKEVARELNIGLRTVERLVETGELPAYRLSPRVQRVRREDLEAYLESRRIENGGRHD